MPNSRAKGKVGELDARDKLGAQLGVKLARGAQHKGGPASADITMADGTPIPGLHPEVKRTESFRLWDALAQAKGEAPEGSVPLVLHRKNGKPWVAVVELDRLMDLVEAVATLRGVPVYPKGAE